jgi:hypothetical protein
MQRQASDPFPVLQRIVVGGMIQMRRNGRSALDEVLQPCEGPNFSCSKGLPCGAGKPAVPASPSIAYFRLHCALPMCPQVAQQDTGCLEGGLGLS